MIDHLEFWTIATVVVALGWRRWRQHGTRRPSLMVGRSHRRRRGPGRRVVVSARDRNPQSRGRPRVFYSQRDLDRAYKAGVDTGAAIGPDDKTRRRWQRQGFEHV